MIHPKNGGSAMTALRNPISSALVRWVDTIRQRRRRRIGERIMNSLPPSLQDDIGWRPSRRFPPR
jgi:hypothetical protein